MTPLSTHRGQRWRRALRCEPLETRNLLAALWRNPVDSLDVDGDGFDDIYSTDSKLGGKNHLYHNNGNGTFTGSIDLQFGSSTVVVGTQATGVLINSQLTGNLNVTQIMTVSGEDSTAIRVNAPIVGEFTVARTGAEEFHIFGSLGADGFFTETTAYSPNSPYSASKAGSDHLVRAWHHTYGLPVVITNCSNNYGPYHFPEKLIPLAIIKALHGEAIPVYGTGANVRDWLHVEDHADAEHRNEESCDARDLGCGSGH